MKKRVILPLLLVAALILPSCATKLGDAEAAEKWLKQGAAATSAQNTADNKAVDNAEQTPFDLFASLNNYAEGADSLIMNMFMIMSMNIMGVSMDVTADISMAEVIREDGVDMAMLMSMETMGYETVIEMYMTDGWTYTNSEGMKTKTSAEVTDSSAFTDLISGFGLNFAEEMIMEQNAEYIDDNNILISFTLDGENMLGATNMVMGMTGLTEMGSINGLSDVEVEVMITDGELAYIAMSFSCELDMMGLVVPVTYEIVIEIEQIGGVTIEFPDDLDTYELIEY